MCGIVGFFGVNASHAANARHSLDEMVRTLRHRGPDAQGAWCNEQLGIYFGHTRLSIIDLSEAGSQPMVIGRHAITFNGEIYNYLSLREELLSEGVEFRGHSDTEVVLNALIRWGVETTLKRVEGMFAFGFYDGEINDLVLARDRFGEKPLYYGKFSGSLLFGSEIRALRVHPAFVAEINHRALSSFLRAGFIQPPETIYNGLYQLAPGHYLRIGGRAGATPEVCCYWSVRNVIEKRVITSLKGMEIVDRLEDLLFKAVKLRMVADVPIGAFLSGGVDSSTIVALMQRCSSRPVKTFTIGFWEGAYDEARDAANVARHLGTEHHELYLSPREAIGIIEKIPSIYDEPFGDASQIPTFLVSEFTRRHVTVAISGDGGDELFGGYNRHTWTQRVWPRLQRLPSPVQEVLRRVLLSVGTRAWDSTFSAANIIMPHQWKVRGGGERLLKLARAMGSRSAQELYSRLLGSSAVYTLLNGANSETTLFDLPEARGLGVVEQLMFWDQICYLPSDILCKVDRASMSVGLETRVPFLDSDLFAFAWSLSLEEKIKNGVGKWPLRQVLQRHVPNALFERPKTGFSVPIKAWLEGPLKEWADGRINDNSIGRLGILDGDAVKSLWLSFLAGDNDEHQVIWRVLMLQTWFEEYHAN